MRTTIFLAALALLARSLSAAAEPDDLTVMTFNLRYASYQGANAWPQRRPVTKSLIEQTRPDMIGTQEGVYQQIKDIAADLPEYDWIGTGRDSGSRGEFMAVFFRRDRFEPLEYDHYWLSDTPNVVASSTWGNSNRRMVTWVKFRDRPTKRDFYFINTHFDHQIQEAREKSAALVLDRVARLKTRLPVILVGDFNAVAGRNKAYDTLVNDAEFKDSWLVAKERGPEINTFHNYGGPRPGSDRIDWILLRGPVDCLSTEVVAFQLAGQYPSDHFPVLARLKWAVE